MESAWESSGDASSVTAFSPATGLTYTMSCTASGTGYEVCTGGNNAYVEFPVTSAPAQSSGQFDNLCTQCAVSTLSESIANEQQAALEAAPTYDYDSPDNASVNVSLTPLGDNTYAATATDSDGDTGSGDTITVSPDGNSWSDTGMSWSGPDVSRRPLHLLDHPSRERLQLKTGLPAARSSDIGRRSATSPAMNRPSSPAACSP